MAGFYLILKISLNFASGGMLRNEGPMQTMGNAQSMPLQNPNIPRVRFMAVYYFVC